MNIYLGHWERGDFGHGFEIWRPPGGDCRGCFDFRTRAQKMQFSGLPQGYGLFVYDDLRVHPLLIQRISDRPDVLLPANVAAAMRTLLGVNLGRDTLTNMIRQARLDPAMYDATGTVRWSPGRMTSKKKSRFWLQPFGLLWDESVDASHPAHAGEIATFTATYKRKRDIAENKPAAERDAIISVLKRYTGATMRKVFSRMDDQLAQAILPVEYRLDGWETPKTTFTETWPTNGTTLSTGQDEPWTENAGNPAVSSNVLVFSLGAVNHLHCDTTLSSDDHHHTLTQNLTQEATDINFSGPGVRSPADGTRSGFLTIWHRRSNFKSNELFDMPSFTSLAQSSTDQGDGSKTIDCEADGDQISGTVGAVSLGPATDTDWAGEVNVWCDGRNDTSSQTLNTLDDHTAEDLAVAVSVRRNLMLLGVGA